MKFKESGAEDPVPGQSWRRGWTDDPASVQWTYFTLDPQNRALNHKDEDTAITYAKGQAGTGYALLVYRALRCAIVESRIEVTRL